MSYVTEVQADTPEHWWRFADPGGALAHDIGSAPLHMHAVGGVPILGYSGPVSGGGSMDISLDNTFAHTGELMAFPGGALTIEFLYWRWRQIGTAGQILYWQAAPLQIAMYNSGAAWSFIYNNILAAAGVGVARVSQRWHHFVGTYDGANIKLYIDGALQATVASGAVVAFNGLLGTYLPGGVNPGFGFYSDLAVYFHALTAARVAAHFAAVDQIGQPPVYQQAGGWTAGSGSGNPLAVDLSTVLSSVRKVY